MVELLSLEGWQMTKFVSNSSEVMAAIPSADRLLEKVVELQECVGGSTKALGLGWHVKEDVFAFKLSEQLQAPLTSINLPQSNS